MKFLRHFLHLNTFRVQNDLCSSHSVSQLADGRANADSEMEQFMARRDAIAEERDHALKQVRALHLQHSRSMVLDWPDDGT